MGQIELKVEEASAEILRYSFPDIRTATEMFVFLRDFFPDGTFILQPLRH
jgi:hypothetical protein